MQQLIAVFGTALGALIGLSSAILNEQFRWRREQVKDRAAVRRQLYSEYVAALTEVHENMRTLSRTDTLSRADLHQAVYEAFNAGGPYKLRYQMALVAGQQVLDAAEVAFRRMRDIRDLFAGGGKIEDDEYQTQRTSWGIELRSMQRAMRNELGSGPVELRGGS